MTKKYEKFKMPLLGIFGFDAGIACMFDMAADAEATDPLFNIHLTILATICVIVFLMESKRIYNLCK